MSKAVMNEKQKTEMELKWITDSTSTVERPSWINGANTITPEEHRAPTTAPTSTRSQNAPTPTQAGEQRELKIYDSVTSASNSQKQGNILGVNDDNTYDILWGDGETEKSVRRETIQSNQALQEVATQTQDAGASSPAEPIISSSEKQTGAGADVEPVTSTAAQPAKPDHQTIEMKQDEVIVVSRGTNETPTDTATGAENREDGTGEDERPVECSDDDGRCPSLGPQLVIFGIIIGDGAGWAALDP